jgi:hypothetical protein
VASSKTDAILSTALLITLSWVLAAAFRFSPGWAVFAVVATLVALAGVARQFLRRKS